jgi:hypothetical protein
MGFGPSTKFPTMGMVPPSRFAPMGMVQDPEEMAMMMGAQNRPRVAQHAQAGPIPPQASASPIRAPKDKAMGFLGKFGRILAGGAYGGENMGWIERLGRGPEGMNAVRDEIRAGKKTAEEEARRRAMAAKLGVDPELFAMDPAIGLQFMQQQQAAAERADERTYDRGRDQVGDERYLDETQYGRGRDAVADTRYETEQERADRLEAEDARRFGLTYGLNLRGVEAAEAKAKAEENATPSVDFGDVKGVRETNEKRFQAFEESQRAFQSMAGLAKQGTGAADIALGFAFFKTFDPNSTVREGEFAQAASAMGLGDRAISILARLDAGEQFTPQLREELVKAASVAYNNQAQDITGLVGREREFADRHGINRQDIARNPIVRIPPPPEAVNELLSNPTPEEIAEFNATFGYGQGEAIVARARRREYGGMNR